MQRSLTYSLERNTNALPDQQGSLEDHSLMYSAVLLQGERRTRDREVAGSIPRRHCCATTLCKSFTPLCLSSSIISWYRCKNREGNGMLWKRCGLPSITLSVSSLSAQDHTWRWAPHPYVASPVRRRCWPMGHFTLPYEICTQCIEGNKRFRHIVSRMAIKRSKWRLVVQYAADFNGSRTYGN